MEQKDKEIRNKEIRWAGTKLGIFLICHQLLFQIGTAVAMLMLVLVFEDIPDMLMYYASDMMQIITGIMFVFLYVLNRQNIKNNPIIKSKLESSSLIKRIVVVIGINMLISTIEILCRRAFGVCLMPVNISSSMNVKENLVAYMLCVAVFPAVVEEILYRGVLYRVLRKHGVMFAGISSSIIFGLIHMNFVQIPFAIVLGLVACYLYEKTGRLRYSMLVHFINNAVSVVLSVLPLEVVDTMQVVMGVLFALGIIIYKSKHKSLIKKCSDRYEKGAARDVLCYFTSIPMLLLVVGCIIVSCLMIEFM